MEQYLAIKAKHKNAVLFFRMGDFYEMFYEDAQTASQVLGITLTSRAHGKASEVPLAGFPYHALDTYLTKMIKAGHRVAICEQVEDPKKAKGIVKRDIVEIVTPGTTFSDDILESKRNNYVLAVFYKEKTGGLAGVDISTGEFFVSEVPKEYVRQEIQAIEPAELILAESQQSYVEKQLNVANRAFISPREDWTFSRDYGYDILTDHFHTSSLKGFGCDDMDAGISAAGAVLSYVRENQKNSLSHLSQLRRRDNADYLTVDPTTQRNLELIHPLNLQGQKATLISVLDQTRTSMGGRLLVQWLRHPLARVAPIKKRLDAVEEFFSDNAVRNNTRDVLKKIGDLERLVSKISTGRANARDLNAIKSALERIPELREALAACESEYATNIHRGLTELPELVNEIAGGIVDDPPLGTSDGGLIRKGYNEELDRLREIAYSGKDWIAKLQASERERTGIPSLKVKYNKVFGYYIEITNAHMAKVPTDYMRKQTLVNAERFITPELKEYEEQILGAEEKIADLEFQLFDAIRQKVAENVVDIQKNAAWIAQLDCLTNLAEVAFSHQYFKPDIATDDVIEIKDSRHPVVERLLPPGESFVPNDVQLDNRDRQIMIITGPNMAGKSTYLRQVGLVVLMAQMGSFVPAKVAKIGLVDKIFTRVGASDNLAGGESTFLMEMNETANILNNATPKSLILLDEIGRGTSTFDGLSIAWSVAEYLHNTPQVTAKTLFATHYHELTELELILPRVKNYNVAVKEWGDKIVFLRKIVEGGCDHSYGIHVAELAGLPKPVINRAKEVLANLEREELTPNDEPRLAAKPVKSVQSQLDLFTVREHKLQDRLEHVDINSTSPLEALNLINELKQMLGEISNR
ncbi:DNA mismatch repair protein MutS [candidate division KSB1 bacterium]|nr:DNA mismatch repair protein MutS [candidate division KSB1 bacterium]